MKKYLVLLRGINVGGKNKVSMVELRAHLEAAGFSKVATYIASGNLILESDLQANQVSKIVEDLLQQYFKLDSEIIKAHVLTTEDINKVIDGKPAGFGSHPDVFHSDVIFLIGIDASSALKVFSPRDGVDKVWGGESVIYSQRLSEQRTKSRLGRIIGSPLYKQMTIRSWNTVIKLHQLMNQP